jgi:hypothetical protein
MGVYDYVLNGKDEYQLKTWDRRMHAYKIGDTVPLLITDDGNLSGPYSVLLLEDRKWLNVSEQNVIQSITNYPVHLHIYDKWGVEIMPGDNPYAKM